MSIRFLKIKLKALAAEARIIRREEVRLRCSPALGEDIAATNTRERTSLYLHRVITVRREARHTLLAYGFVRGRTREQLEPRCRECPDLSAVLRMVHKYGDRTVTSEALRGWYWPALSEKKSCMRVLTRRISLVKCRPGAGEIRSSSTKTVQQADVAATRGSPSGQLGSTGML